MTPAEILAMSGEVVSELWPDWWTPRKMCPGCLDPNGHAFIGEDDDGLPIITSHEIPPPNLTEPANFVRALKLSGIGVIHTHMGWCAIEDNATPDNAHIVCAKDSPELALLLALHALVRRRKEEANG